MPLPQLKRILQHCSMGSSILCMQSGRAVAHATNRYKLFAWLYFCWCQEENGADASVMSIDEVGLKKGRDTKLVAICQIMSFKK